MADESRSVEVRLAFTREIDALEPLDPATSGQARLEGLELRRQLDRRLLSTEAYSDRLDALTRRVRDARLLLTATDLGLTPPRADR